MAQPQQNISLTAPGFYGLNTQDSPLDMDIQFASVADNAVIDQFGRVASRKGFVQITSNPETLNGNPIVQLQEFRDTAGNSILFACGNNNIYVQLLDGSQALVALTLPAGYTITADDWQIAMLNDIAIFAQAGHETLVYDANGTPDGTGFVPLVTLTTAGTPPVPFGTGSYPNAALGAFGRMWLADFDGAQSILYWSSLLEPTNYDSGDSGGLEVTLYWPNGADEIVALAAHNNFLVVFGRRSILIYNVPDGGPLDPAFRLVDTVEAIGCVGRDSVVPVDEDYYFCDASGVRLLSRTIQEKSIPIGDVSKNVRTDIKRDIQFLNRQDEQVKGVYSVEDSFYAIFFPETPRTYVLDTRFPLQDGSRRVTQWIGVNVRCGERLVDRETLFGGTFGVYQYSELYRDSYVETAGGEPVDLPISFVYATHPLDFGSPSTLLFAKQVDCVFIGGRLSKVCLDWFYDYKLDKENKGEFCKIIGDAAPSALWNTDELWGEASFFTQGKEINEVRYNIWGSGRNIKLQITSDIFGDLFSIQEMNVQALQGRIL